MRAENPELLTVRDLSFPGPADALLAHRRSMMMAKNDAGGFEAVFRDSIQTAMQGIVGEQAARALLFHLKFPDSASHPAEFAKNLQSILLSASPMVETAIVKRLWDEIGLFMVHANDPGSFTDRVERARDFYSQRLKQAQVYAR